MFSSVDQVVADSIGVASLSGVNALQIATGHPWLAGGHLDETAGVGGIQFGLGQSVAQGFFAVVPTNVDPFEYIVEHRRARLWGLRNGRWVLLGSDLLPLIDREYQVSTLYPSDTNRAIQSDAGRLDIATDQWVQIFDGVSAAASDVSALVFSIQARLIRSDYSSDSVSTGPVGVLSGINWLDGSGGLVGECCHGSIRVLSDRWSTFSSATIINPSFTNQVGLTEASYRANPAPVDAEAEVWVELGAQAFGAQSFVLRRSDVVTTDKEYSFSVVRGSVRSGSVTIPAYTNSAEFSGPIGSGGGSLFVSDGSVESFYFDFTYGSGSATVTTSSTTASGFLASWFPIDDGWAKLTDAQTGEVDAVDIAGPVTVDYQQIIELTVTALLVGVPAPDVPFDPLESYSLGTIDVTNARVVNGRPLKLDTNGEYVVRVQPTEPGEVLVKVTIGGIEAVHSFDAVDSGAYSLEQSVWGQPLQRY